MLGLSGLTCEANTFVANGESRPATDGYCHSGADGGQHGTMGVHRKLKLDDEYSVVGLTSTTCEDSVLGLTEVAWHSEPSHIYLGSPSILRLPNRTILITVRPPLPAGTCHDCHCTCNSEHRVFECRRTALAMVSRDNRGT